MGANEPLLLQDFLDSPRRRKFFPPLGLLVHSRFNLKLAVVIMFRGPGVEVLH